MAVFGYDATKRVWPANVRWERKKRTIPLIAAAHNGLFVGYVASVEIERKIFVGSDFVCG